MIEAEGFIDFPFSTYVQKKPFDFMFVLFVDHGILHFQFYTTQGVLNSTGVRETIQLMRPSVLGLYLLVFS